MKRKLILKVILKLTAFLLLFVSIFVAYWWFYKLPALRHLTDQEWLRNHTEKARWEEEQKKYFRMGMSPDLCFAEDRIGYYGDEKCFKWLVGKMQDPKGFRVCGCTETALMFMSNRHEESWIEWLEKNQNKTQEEWIHDGFKKIGIQVHNPPVSEDIEPLLKLMGKKTWGVLFGGPKDEKKAPEAIQSYLKYNAFRWLRDSGFDPLQYSLDHREIPEDIKKGLIVYSKWNDAFPKTNDVGILFVDKTEKVEEDDFLIPPPIAQKKYIALAYSLIIFPFIGAVLLFIFPRKNKKFNEPPKNTT